MATLIKPRTLRRHREEFTDGGQAGRTCLVIMCHTQERVEPSRGRRTSGAVRNVRGVDLRNTSAAPVTIVMPAVGSTPCMLEL